MNASKYTYTEKSKRGIFFGSVIGESYEKAEEWNFYYEKDNHLGNVLAVVSDRKIGTDLVNNATGNAPPDGLVDFYTADVVSANDYYSFGSPMPGRQFNSTEYRFDFNGKPTDHELNDWQDYGERMYMKRLGRFPTPDPLIIHGGQYPELSPYQFASNNPIMGIDLDGLEFANPQLIMKQKLGEATQKVASFTDVNDATVLATWMTRGKDAINIDGTKASGWDKGFATAGAFIPFVSGSLLKSGLKSFKNWALGSADAVNDVYKAKGFYAPYKAGTEVLTFQTSKTEKFVRVFGEGGNAQGSWMMKEADLLDDAGKMLNPKDIQNKFSLPGLPNKMVDVNVPTNTIMRSGEAAPVKKLGTQGGGTQFELLDEIPENSFGTPRDL